jgi:hypothetical protein
VTGIARTELFEGHTRLDGEGSALDAEAMGQFLIKARLVSAFLAAARSLWSGSLVISLAAGSAANAADPTFVKCWPQYPGKSAVESELMRDEYSDQFYKIDRERKTFQVFEGMAFYMWVDDYCSNKKWVCNFNANSYSLREFYDEEHLRPAKSYFFDRSRGSLLIQTWSGEKESSLLMACEKTTDPALRSKKF